MNGKNAPSDAAARRESATIASRDGARIAGEYMDENALISDRRFRTLDSRFSSSGEMAGDFVIRKRVNCQASFLRGDYPANSRMERFRGSGDNPADDPGESGRNFPKPGNIEDQHLVRPERG